VNGCRPALQQPGESVRTDAEKRPAVVSTPLPDAAVIAIWNGIAQAGGTLQETLIRFARLIEAEVRR